MGMILVFIVILLVVIGGAAAYLKVTKKGMFADEATKLARAKGTGGPTVKEVTDNRRLGYRYCEEDPFFFIKDGGVWTGVKMAAATDEFDTDAEQEETVRRNTQARQSLLDYFTNKDPKREARVQCHELVRNQPIDTESWLRTYHEAQWDPSALFTDLVDSKVEPHISDAAPERAHYLLVRLGDQTAPRRIDPIAAVVDADDELADELFSTVELSKFRKLADDVTQRMAPYSTPMSRAELAWLIRKPLSGTFPVDVKRDYSRTRWARNSWFDQITDFHGINLKQQAAVQVMDPNPAGEGEPASSYTTTLTVSTAETQLPFEYWDAWGRVLAGLPNPPEISWRYALISESLFSKQLRKATNNITDEVKDRTKDGSEQALVDTKFGELAAISDMVRESQELRPRAGMIGQLRINLTAPTLEQLDLAEQAVRDVMKGFCELERRKSIQHQLLEEQLPGDFTSINAGKLILNSDINAIDVGTRWTDLNILAMARMDASPTVGDDQEVNTYGNVLGWHGHVIGYAAQNGSIVHFDPFVQIDRNSGAGTAIIGASGSGKSTLALCLFFWITESGSQGVALDPKNDFEKFVLYLAFGSQVLAEGFREEANKGLIGTPKSRFQPINREFWDETRVISLTYGDNGSMDPWVLTGDYDAGDQLARRQIEHLFADHDAHSPDRTLLELAFNKLREKYSQDSIAGKNPRLPRLGDLITQVAGQLEFYQEILEPGTADHAARMQAQQHIGRIQVLQERLTTASKAEYSRLLFGSEDNDSADSALRGFTHRRTVITMIGFKLPSDPEKIRTETAARNASAVMFTVLWQVEKLFSSVGDTISPNKRRMGLRPRILFVDEAYMITSIESGAEMLNIALRQGRSLNFGVIIISQQASDIGKIESAETASDDADQNQFSTMFVFKQKGAREAKTALRLLRSGSSMTDVEADILSQQLMLPTGHCVMKDCDGRVGTVVVDSLFKELFSAAQTNPSLRPSFQSVDPPLRGSDWNLQPETRDSTRRAVVRERLDEATTDAVFEYPEYEYATK